jgi:hypothetical protein
VGECLFEKVEKSLWPLIEAFHAIWCDFISCLKSKLFFFRIHCLRNDCAHNFCLCVAFSSSFDSDRDRSELLAKERLLDREGRQIIRTTAQLPDVDAIQKTGGISIREKVMAELELKHFLEREVKFFFLVDFYCENYFHIMKMVFMFFDEGF